MEAKKIKIRDLPDGYYKGQLTQLVQSTETEIYVAAKEGMISDWAAYCGWPDLMELKPQFQDSGNYSYYCTRVHRPEDVADRGDKFPESEARELFPNWAGNKQLRYRS